MVLGHLTLRVIQKESELEGVATVSSLKELPSPSKTSVSIVTPAKASSTLDIIILPIYSTLYQ